MLEPKDCEVIAESTAEMLLVRATVAETRLAAIRALVDAWDKLAERDERPGQYNDWARQQQVNAVRECSRQVRIAIGEARP